MFLSQISHHELRKTLKFIYSEKATKFCKIFLLLLSVCTVDKSKETISQNFVGFSEYTNFNKIRISPHCGGDRATECDANCQYYIAKSESQWS